jgi:hypothetical protein
MTDYERIDLKIKYAQLQVAFYELVGTNGETLAYLGAQLNRIEMDLKNHGIVEFPAEEKSV